jgi:hypothetical protein
METKNVKSPSWQDAVATVETVLHAYAKQLAQLSNSEPQIKIIEAAWKRILAG